MAEQQPELTSDGADGTAFDREVARIEAEIRALFETFGAKADAIPPLLFELARELDEVLAKATTAGEVPMKPGRDEGLRPEP